ncbi:MAG TPA: outer membrane beta-barrel protein [Cyclobacteriaceae bacterium]|nr:outer membrane beta-barrel protein [Cyclobacteriaceae bacterium]
MKALIVLLLTTVLIPAFSQSRLEFLAGYSYASPSGKMEQNIRQGHGVTLGVQRVALEKKMSLGLDLNYTIYGLDQSRQQYTFDDGTVADMDVRVINSFTNLMASVRYNLLSGKKITPYVGFRGGYAWLRTNLNIYDPNDLDHCEPVETALLYKDGTLVYAAGGGLQYDLTRIFKRLPEGLLGLNLSAFYTQGGMVKYMNTDSPNHHTPAPANRVGDLTADFINTQTQVVHKHHVGYVYSSLFKMTDFRVTITSRLPY